MTATSMAVSEIAGKTINPGQMDQYLDTHGGYSGNGLVWGKAAQAAGLSAAKPAGASTPSTSSSTRAARGGRRGLPAPASTAAPTAPTTGSPSPAGARRAASTVYYANDPATGKQITLHTRAASWLGGPKDYKTTGELVTFSGGNPPKPGTAAGAPRRTDGSGHPAAGQERHRASRA